MGLDKLNWLFIFVIIGLTSCSGPKSIFQLQQDGNKAPVKVETINESTDAESYEWDFGDGYISNDSLANHRYYKSGRYTVKLKATKGKKESVTTKELIVQPPDECLVLISTSKGNMIARLFDETPKHRDNFLKIADEGFYNDLLFHRVIKGFMIQGGDPNSRGAKPDARLGSGGPPYRIDAEFRSDLAHVKGALSAARAPDNVNPEKRSSGSQFYIVHGRAVTESELDQVASKKGINYPPDIKEQYNNVGGYPFLDQDYTVFGVVIEGLEIIDIIAGTETGRGDRPVEDVKMKISVIK